MAEAQPASRPLAEDDAALEEAVVAGSASLEAGRAIPYESVRRWLLSWGADEELIPLECR